MCRTGWRRRCDEFQYQFEFSGWGTPTLLLLYILLYIHVDPSQLCGGQSVELQILHAAHKALTE